MDDRRIDIGNGDGERRLERAEALAAVMRREAEKAIAQRQARPKRFTMGPGFLFVVAGLNAYVWFGAPAWLHPAPPPPIPMEQLDSSLRLTMYVQSQRIEAFRIENGRLPTTLEEAGSPLAGMEYTILSDTIYEIQGVGDDIQLTLQSTDSMALFMGDAEDMLHLRPIGYHRLRRNVHL